MLTSATTPPTENPGWRRCFASRAMTLGLFLPIESTHRATPALLDQERLVRRAEELGFSALWFRDIPLRDPRFGDVGQVFDVFVYLAWMAAQTSQIALATGAIALPLYHPLHVAKAAASIDQLSRGRLVLGVAAGDRPVEFPAFGRDRAAAAGDVRAALDVIRRALDGATSIDSPFGVLRDADVVPRPVARGLPIVVAGGAGQTLDWIAANSDGWITWPRPPDRQAEAIAAWRAAVERATPGRPKPFAQALFLDLASDPTLPAWPIHLGYRIGRRALLAELERLEALGVAHVALNLTSGRRPAGDVLEELAEIVSRFSPAPALPTA